MALASPCVKRRWMINLKCPKLSFFHVMVFGITSFVLLLIILYTAAVTAIFAFEEMQIVEHELRGEKVFYEKMLALNPDALPLSTENYFRALSYEDLPKRVQNEFANQVIEEGEIYHSFAEDDEVWLIKLALKDGRFLFVALLDPDDVLPELTNFDAVDQVFVLLAIVLLITVAVVILFAYSILRQLRSLEGY
ncbi:MAG: hypothetical protein OIF54_00710, partial [Cohaesibacter sp.]|nr:hypothetical protein [Cohaesibacter sp.]